MGYCNEKAAKLLKRRCYNGNKFCKKCGKEFTPSKDDSRIKYCSTECRLADKRQYNVRYYHSHKEESRAYRQSDKYKKIRAAYNERRKERYKNDENFRNEIREKVKRYQDGHPEMRLAQRVKQYGLTLDDYKELQKKQNGKCAICGAEIGNSEGDRLYVDHNHKTGKVRGILCSNCNIGIGKFHDNISLLKRAIEYLEKTDGTGSDLV